MPYNWSVVFLKNEILTDYLNVSPFGRNNKGKNISVLRRSLKVSLAYLRMDLTVPQAPIWQVYLEPNCLLTLYS